MAITYEWLKASASDKSFHKGQDITESQDIEIVKVGKLYTAKVYGESAYKVVFEDVGSEPIATCTCPFDWGGICKHIVAVGLTILECGYDPEEEMTFTLSEEKPNYVAKSVDSFFEKTFLKAEIETQHAFLRQLFSQNPTFMAQFDAFTKAETAPVDTKSITAISQKVAKSLSKIPLDIEDMYNSNNYDYDDEDDGTDWAIEKLEKKLNPYIQQGLGILAKGDLIDFLVFEIGVYEGLLLAEEPIYNEDYVDIFEDYNASLTELFSAHLEKAFPVLSTIILRDSTTNACSNLLLDRAAVHQKSNKLRDYDFRDWEAFWLHLIQSKGSAQYLLHRLKTFSLFLPQIPRLVMKAAKIIGDRETWAATAEAYCVGNKDILIEILDSYQQENNIQRLIVVIRRVFAQNKNDEINTLLLKYLSPEADKYLYVELLGVEVEHKCSLTLYKKFAELASPEAKKTLIATLKKGYDRLFYAKVLAEEKKYEKIFRLIENEHDERNIPALLQLIVPHLTEKAWKWTQTWALNKLETGRRSRELYKVLAQGISSFLPIKEYAPQVKFFAAKLQANYTRLSALKEELQHAKLI